MNEGIGTENESIPVFGTNQRHQPSQTCINVLLKRLIYYLAKKH